jgi:hypothetical protein
MSVWNVTRNTLAGKHDMKRINLDYHTIKELRKTHTVREIAQLMNVSVPMITRFIKDNNLNLEVPHSKGNRMCQSCGKRFDRKKMTPANIGLICENCLNEKKTLKEKKTQWKFLYQPYQQ